MSEPGNWRVVLHLYSGRPDPSWILDLGNDARIVETWESLPPFVGDAPALPRLGYRGAQVDDSGHRQWLAFQGAVTLVCRGDQVIRRDATRAMERLLVASAPLGAVSQATLHLMGL